MHRVRHIAGRTAAALVVVGGLIAVAAAPSDSQTLEVGATRGDAYGLLLDISSDLGDDQVAQLPIAELVEAANAGDEAAVESLLSSTGIDFEAAAAAPNPEAVAITIGPIPFVEQPADGSGGLFTDSLAGFGLLGLIGFDLAEVQTEGVLGPVGGSASSAHIEDFFLDELAFIDTLDVECEADLLGVSGATTILEGLTILGPFPQTPGPNTNFLNIDVDLPPLSIVLNVTLNEQESDPDDIEVNGIHTFLSLTLDTRVGPFNLLTIDMVLGHAGCGIDPVEVVTPAPVPVQPRFTG